MENKNSVNIGLVILIVFLTLIVGLLGGYALFKYVQSNEESKNPQIPDGNENTDKEEITLEKDFDLSETKKLMDKYLYNNFCGGELYISDLSDELKKNEIALHSIKEQTVSCSSIYGQSEVSIDGDFFCLGETTFYDYTELLKKKKELFGDESSLDKKFFGNKTKRYDYIEKNDGFVVLEFAGGGDCVAFIENNIQSAKTKGNDLTIVVVEKEFDSDSYENGNKVVTEEVKREYKFKKSETGYYLSAVNEI